MNGRRLFSSIAAGMLASWLVTPALAQTTPAETQPTNVSSEEGFNLDEVTVTARRTTENLQVVPIAITAISADDIRQRNIVDPQDLNGAVPALTVSPAFNSRASSIYVIRGQGQTLGGGDPAVSTYFNEVLTPASGPGYLFDLSGVEVLKGPQGTLFGRNSTGGAILFVPQHPTNEFGGYFDVTAGNYGAQRYQAAVNIPVIDDVLQVRIAADANYRDGYVKNPLNGEEYEDVDYQAARVGITFRPTDWLENYLLFNYATLNEAGPAIELVALNPAVGLGRDPRVQEAFAAQQAWGPRNLNAYVPPTGNFIKARNYAADNTTTIRLSDNITLKNIFGFREFLYAQSYSYYGLPFPNFELIGSPYWSSGQGIPNASNKTYSDEIQLRGDSFGSRLHWTTGLYYDSTSPHSDQDRDLALIGGTTLQSSNALRHGKSRAIYGQVTFDLADQWKLTGGARYTKDTRSQVSNLFYPDRVPCVPGSGNPFPPPEAGLGYCDLTRSADFHATTWNVSAQYQLSPETMFYLASRHGYKSGGFNGVAPSTETQLFQPEYVTDLELGAKTEFQWGGLRGRVNASLFRSKFTDWQERIELTAVTVAGVQRFAVVTNVAAGVIQGGEIEATLIPTEHLEFTGYYSYLDPTFTDNVINGVNFDHVRVPNAPKHKASATARTLFNLPGNSGEASLALTYSYQSAAVSSLIFATREQLATSTDPFRGATPSFGVLDLRADWKEVFGRPLTLSAFMSNVTDKVYLNRLTDSWRSQGKDGGSYGAPRMYGLSARWDF